jgi:hypothetical protein
LQGATLAEPHGRQQLRQLALAVDMPPLHLDSAKPVALISETIALGGQKSAKSRVFASGK